VGDDLFHPPTDRGSHEGQEFYSLHSDADAKAKLLVFSSRLTEPPFERLDGFWP